MNRKLNYVVGLLAVFALSVSCITNNKKENNGAFNANEMLDYCVEKTKKSIAKLSYADSLPRNIYNNQTEWNKVGVSDWTSGFWPGVLWYAYDVTGDSEILKSAKKFTTPLESVLENPTESHDLGFMFFCSFGNGYKLTKDAFYKKTLLRAADSLATLYNPTVGTILSWPSMREKMNWPHNTIIDNLMNLELLFWASKNGGDNKLFDIAKKHAETSMKHLVRDDYSTFHVAVFDTVDGHFIKGVTHQGYADSSLWARGQSWGIYGFTMCYRETGNEEFLVTAQKLADVFLERLPEDGIPYWDFDCLSIPNSPKDASAAAVAASGMLELSTLVKEPGQETKYKNAAVKLLQILSSDEYLSRNINQAMLMHATGHLPHSSEIDASIIYADYYFIEALTRLKKIEKN